MKQEVTLAKDSIKILVCCHKPCELPPNPDGILLPIQVGAAISNVDLGMQRDDQVNGEPCDNISAKNKSYCELTALYWAWKNIKRIYPDLKYIGLNHYRRYFTNKNSFMSFEFLKFKIFSVLRSFMGKNIPYAFNPNKNISFSEIGKFTNSLKTCFEKNIANGKEIFCTQDVRMNCGCVNDFFNVVGRSNIDFFKKIVSKMQSKYASAFQKTLNSRCFCYGNMFVMPFSLFCEYCEFLFSVVEDYEQEANKSGFYIDVLKEKSAERLFGYFGEMLTNSFIKSQPKEKVVKLGTCFVK